MRVKGEVTIPIRYIRPRREIVCTALSNNGISQFEHRVSHHLRRSKVDYYESHSTGFRLGKLYYHNETEEASNESPPVDLITLHRTACGILIFLSNTRFDSSTSTTQTHIEMDSMDMKHRVAYLWATKELGVTYHRHRPCDSRSFHSFGSTDYAFRVFIDGMDQIGLMLTGGHRVGTLSAPILVISCKDSGS
jgi:hypothetical protein